MGTIPTRRDRNPAHQQTGKLYIESTLLRIAGGLFCHDAKRAGRRTHEIILTRGASERTIIIRPDPKFGQPGPLAHKLFVALIKKHSDYGRPIRKEITFTKREVMRLIGRKHWGGRDSEQLARALHGIHHTFIRTQFRNRDGHFVEHSFNVFPEILIERREFASDPIESCTVTLAAPIVASLQEQHFTCLNHEIMTQLGTIGQALYMRLFFHFANLYDHGNGLRLALQKRYDDICVEWMGGLTVLNYKSQIASDQLGPHLDQLIQIGFLASYTIDRARSRDGFVATFRPGLTFFTDYDRFYRRRQLVQDKPAPHTADRGTSEPLKLAYLFAEKRTGQSAESIPFVSSKEVESAKQILRVITLAEAPTFLHCALTQAARSRFPVQTLGGIRQYLPDYLAGKGRAAAIKAQEAARAAEHRRDAEQLSYERFRHVQATELFDVLPASERESVLQSAQAHVARFREPIRSSMLTRAKLRVIIERYETKLASFEQWKAKQ